MSPLDQIQETLRSEFPELEMVVRGSEDVKGMQFLNVYADDLEIAVEWKPDAGFGLSAFQGNFDDLQGAYDAPDEWYHSPRAVFHRICSLLIDQQTTKATCMGLGAIRRELGISQEELSEALKVTQATYSKLERRADMKVSTLRKAVEALGGVLRIEAKFPGAQGTREVTIQ